MRGKRVMPLACGRIITCRVESHIDKTMNRRYGRNVAMCGMAQFSLNNLLEAATNNVQNAEK